MSWNGDLGVLSLQKFAKMGGEACHNPEGKISGRKGIKAQQLFEDTNDGVDDDEEPVEVIEEEGSGSKF